MLLNPEVVVELLVCLAWAYLVCSYSQDVKSNINIHGIISAVFMAAVFYMRVKLLACNVNSSVRCSLKLLIGNNDLGK